MLLSTGQTNSQEMPKNPPKIDHSVLGVKFGDSYKRVAKKTKLEEASVDGPFKSYTTDKMPKGLSDANIYVLVFYKNTLVKVAVLGKPYTGDPYGTEGMAGYNKYKALLAKKYKETNDFGWINREVYTEPSEFWECLAYKSGVCGLYSTHYEGPGRAVSISLAGARGGGFYKLSFESSLFEEAVLEYQAEKKASDSEGL